MKTLHGAAILCVALFCGPPLPNAPSELTEITDPYAIQYGEVSFTYPGDEEDNAMGEAFVDFQVLNNDGFTDGYIQVVEYDGVDPNEASWVVRNLPIASPSVTPGTAVLFGFGGPPPPGGGPRGSVHVNAYRTNHAVARPPNPRPRPPPIVRNTTPVNTNARGIAITAAVLPNPNGPVMSAFDAKTTPDSNNSLPGPERDSVEQDVNQCCPGAVSNSMEYLKQEQGVAVDAVLGTNNGPGINGRPPTSRVAQIDAQMGRVQGQALFPREVIDGKLKFIKAAGIDNALDVKHWGRVCDRNGRCAEGDITVNGVTSRRSNQSCADFIKREIDDGEDVEMLVAWRGPSGQVQGHCVQVTGYDIARGELSVRIVEDALQGFDARTGTTAINGGVGPGAGGGHGTYRLRKQGSFLRVVNLHNAVVVNVISESKKP